ncbi:UbiA family prenyltransferase [bacterium]|nr:UbiA family prenyltransferase [bacterium]
MWRYLFPVLKPERMVIAHIAFFVAVIGYSENIDNWGKLVMGILGFLLFYGALYVVNDIFGFDTDRQDKHNKRRIIASGKLSRKTAGYFAIILWLIALGIFWWSAPVVIWITIVLWGMNVLYSGWLKAFPYVDLLFISWTHPLKFILGALLCGISLQEISVLWPLLLAVYFGALLMHAEKQLGKLQENRQRTFFYGRYTKAGLNILRWIGLLGGYGFAFSLTENGFFWPTLAMLLGVSFLRFFMPGKKSLSLVEKFEEIWQPR